MGSSEFTKWQAVALIEPFGGPVEDLRAGLAPAAILNVNRAPDSKEPPVSPLGFYGWHKVEPPAPKKLTPLEVAQRIKSLLSKVKPK